MKRIKFGGDRPAGLDRPEVIPLDIGIDKNMMR
jgi:hypothetical protein